MMRYGKVYLLRPVMVSGPFGSSSEDFLSDTKGHEMWSEDGSDRVWVKTMHETFWMGPSAILKAVPIEDDAPTAPSKRRKKQEAKADPTAA